nr:reverse transcriptase domain-containing protein [Tanacetum cinerariifolium]
KPTESEGFEQIVDFLNANLIKYALIVNLTIYTSCIQQFWDSAKVKTVNEDVYIRALVDGKKIIITEASIRRDLQLQDAEGTACLPNATIFEEFARMGVKLLPGTNSAALWHLQSPAWPIIKNSTFPTQRKHKSRRKQRKETEVPHTEPQTKDHIPKPSHDPLPSGEDRMQLSELMEICIKLSDMVLSLEQFKTNQATKIEKLKKRVKNLEGKKKKRTYGLKRLYKGRMNDEDLFGVNDLDGDEVIMDVTAGKNVKQDATVAEKKVSATADEVVTTVESVEVITAATTPQISKDDVTLAQTLIEIKAAKPRARGVIVQEPSEFKTTSSSQPSQLPQAKDKGKGIMVKPKKPLKKKDQIAFDEEVARKLNAQMKAEMEEEERIAKEKDKRAEDIKNKPPTKAQQKSLMCTYIKIMEGYKQKDFKGKSFDVIKKMFSKVYKRVNTFVAMDSEVMEGSKKTQAEVTEGSSKRAGDEIEQESAKRQRVHSMFHESNLKKCLSDESLVIPLDEIQIDDKLHFVEEPIEIMDREVKRLKQNRIPSVKDVPSLSGNACHEISWLLMESLERRRLWKEIEVVCVEFGCHFEVELECEFTLSSLDVLQRFSFFLQIGLTLILATLDGLDVGLLGDVIGEDDCDDDG